MNKKNTKNKRPSSVQSEESRVPLGKTASAPLVLRTDQVRCTCGNSSDGDTGETAEESTESSEREEVFEDRYPRTRGHSPRAGPVFQIIDWSYKPRRTFDQFVYAPVVPKSAASSNHESVAPSKPKSAPAKFEKRISTSTKSNRGIPAPAKSNGGIPMHGKYDAGVSASPVRSTHLRNDIPPDWKVSAPASVKTAPAHTHASFAPVKASAPARKSHAPVSAPARKSYAPAKSRADRILEDLEKQYGVVYR